MNSINIKEKFLKFSKNWHPHQIAIVDDIQVLLAEKLSTAHTGTIKHDKTISNYPKI